MQHGLKHIKLITIFALYLFSTGFIFKESEETVLEIAYLERFTRFIDWPLNSEFSTSKDFRLGVIGENPFGDYLDKAFFNQKIKGKKVKIIYFNNIEEIKNIDMLYISSNMENKLEKLLNRIKHQPILTISHSEDFCAMGVQINLFLSGDNLKFEINEKAVKESGLKMSHLLLKQARIVE